MAEPKHAKSKASASARKPADKADQPENKAKAKAKTKTAPKQAKSAAKPKAAKPRTATKPKSTSSPEIYTDPQLRDRLKEEITAGDKGGKPGQWSARKAQLLAHEYEKAGGDYKNGKKKKTDSQKHLDQWTDEDWKTADDKPAEREGGTTRYLPAEAWDQLTPKQKKETNARKQAGSNQGEQFVANTKEAKEARQAASKTDDKKPGSEPKTTAKARTGPKTKVAKAKPKSSK